VHVNDAYDEFSVSINLSFVPMPMMHMIIFSVSINLSFVSMP
jgi:hypothetical protein